MPLMPPQSSTISAGCLNQAVLLGKVQKYSAIVAEGGQRQSCSPSIAANEFPQFYQSEHAAFSGATGQSPDFFRKVLKVGKCDRASPPLMPPQYATI